MMSDLESDLDELPEKLIDQKQLVEVAQESILDDYPITADSIGISS
jgi:hypothetical protein